MPPVRLSLFAMLLVPAAGRGAEPAVDYRAQVRPILRERCYACHGALQQKAKLRLDSGALIRKGGTSGPAVVPGKPDESELLTRVAAQGDDTRMPPEGHPLKPEQIALLRRWVSEGAAVPADDKPEADPRDHWSFRTPTRPPVPELSTQYSVLSNPIDRFVAAGWEKHKLKPVGPADKRVLLRRAYLDLIGLPPTPEQAAAFLADTAPDAYDKNYEQKHTAHQYGERWLQHIKHNRRYTYK
jgi:mono/diheme cytochrome c family protein